MYELSVTLLFTDVDVRTILRTLGAACWRTMFRRTVTEILSISIRLFLQKIQNK
jgi:hypothetical protein